MLPQFAEQYRLCEAKLKRVKYIGSQDLEHVFTPPTSLALNLHNKDISGPKQNIDKTKSKSIKFKCRYEYHSLQECFLFNLKFRPEKWTNNRPLNLQREIYNILSSQDKLSATEKELGHKVPSELLTDPDKKQSTKPFSTYDFNIHENYITDMPLQNDFRHILHIFWHWQHHI